MSEQEQSQEQDRRGSEAWHPPGYTDSEAWRGSARVAWRLQWGLVACIGLPPPPLLVDSAAGPRIPPNPISPTPIFPSQPLSPQLRSGCWKQRSRTLGIAKRESRKSFRDRTAPGGDPALPQLRHSRPLGNTLLRPWAPWPIRNWWWFLEPQVSEPGLAVPPLVCRKSGCGSNRHMGGRGRQNLSTVWRYIYMPAWWLTHL